MLSQEGLKFWNVEMKDGDVESQGQSHAKRKPQLRSEDPDPRPRHRRRRVDTNDDSISEEAPDMRPVGVEPITLRLRDLRATSCAIAA
jgi:hypothetical protein